MNTVICGSASDLLTPEELERGRRSLARKWATDDFSFKAPSADATFFLGGKVDPEKVDRAMAVTVGAAVGDALGAPFEFGEAGSFSARFPVGRSENEMTGGGVWSPGEFTDDTQMAVMEALSIIERQEIDELDLYSRFREWVLGGPKDVGLSTRSVLMDPAGWPDAPRRYYEANPNSSAGNGAMMRSSFAASRWAFTNANGTAEVGRRLAVVTHGDPAAGEGRALFHMLVRRAIRGEDPFVDVESLLESLKTPEQSRFAQALDGSLSSTFGNGSVWGCLRDAVASVRWADSFEEAMRRACDHGGDVDTVAAVAGGLAGPLFGADSIPTRWIESLAGVVGGKVYRAEDLMEVMEHLLDVEEPGYPPSKNWYPDKVDVRYGYEEFFETRLRRRPAGGRRGPRSE